MGCHVLVDGLVAATYTDTTMDVISVGTRSLGISEQVLAEFCRRNQIWELAVFGSILRADFDDKTSDIDVLVEFEPEAVIGFIALARIQDELTNLIGRPVDLVSRAGLKPLIREQILTDAITLYAN